jgi:hypothetical protein
MFRLRTERRRFYDLSVRLHGALGRAGPAAGDVLDLQAALQSQEQDAFVEECGRHFPGLAPAIRAVGCHRWEQDRGENVTCCSGARGSNARSVPEKLTAPRSSGQPPRQLWLGQTRVTIAPATVAGQVPFWHLALKPSGNSQKQPQSPQFSSSLRTFTHCPPQHF